MKLLLEASQIIHTVSDLVVTASLYTLHALSFNMALPYVAPIAFLALKAAAVNNGLAKTPQMGWVCITMYTKRFDLG